MKYTLELPRQIDSRDDVTVENAIIHCREIQSRCTNASCAFEHGQLAEWLEELLKWRQINKNKQ